MIILLDDSYSDNVPVSYFMNKPPELEQKFPVSMQNKSGGIGGFFSKLKQINSQPSSSICEDNAEQSKTDIKIDTTTTTVQEEPKITDEINVIISNSLYMINIEMCLVTWKAKW